MNHGGSRKRGGGEMERGRGGGSHSHESWNKFAWLMERFHGESFTLLQHIRDRMRVVV